MADHLGVRALRAPLDLDRRRRERNTRVIAAGIAVVDLALLGYLQTVEAPPALHVLTASAGVGFAASRWWATRLRVEIASAMVVGGLLGVLVASVPIMGQLAATPYYFGITLLVAAATMRPRGVLVTGVCTLAALGATFYLSAGVAERPMQGSGVIANAAAVCVLTGIVATLQAASTQRTMRASVDAETRIAESEARYRLIADNTSDLIALLDDEGRFLYASPSFERVLGHRPSALVGQVNPDLVEGDDLPRWAAQWASTLRIGYSRDTYRACRADGAMLWMEVVLNAVDDGGKRLVVMTSRDVTLQRALAEQLQQSQKMDALGKLAGGVAHDFNNVLAIIQACSELLLAKLPADAPSRGLVEEMLRAEARAAALTRQLMAFARREKVPVERVDIARALREISELLPRLLAKDIALHVDLTPGLWDVFAAPVQIEQIVMNLAVNARDAMPGGGSFTIAAQNRAMAGEGGGLSTGDCVELTLRDSGIGKCDEVKRHLFEPFFTTKAASGTGLGLATCYALATQLGGTITVESTLGVGTTFTVLLRRADAVLGAGETRAERAREAKA